MATEEKKETTTEVAKDLNNPATGAGTPPSKLDDKKDAILPFAEIAETLAFKSMLQSGLSEDGNWTVHDYLQKIMRTFYHQIYYIPNLRNHKCIVVKPETLFINAPSCNVIYPNMKATIGYSRQFKQEPTRLLQITDPMAAVSDTKPNVLMSLQALVHMEQEKIGVTKYGMPIYKSFVLSNGEQNLTSRNHPLNNISGYEAMNGIRSTTVSQGADIYIYLMASSKKTGLNDDGSEAFTYTLGDKSKEEKENIANTLAKLARYELCRQRYSMRNGSVDMYFNPYIVPGFPMINVESHKGAMNIYGYVTNVVHNLTDRSWTTTVAFSAAHTDNEQTPGVFPVIESEYAAGLPNTYKYMLGPTVTPVGNEELPELMSRYNQENDYITKSYRKVWRETPTLKEYLAHIADGAVEIEDAGFTVLQNNPNAKFFDESLQARLREYSRQVMTGRAFALEDVN